MAASTTDVNEQTLQQDFNQETKDTSNADFQSVLTDFVVDIKGIKTNSTGDTTNNSDSEISSLSQLKEKPEDVLTEFKNDALALDLYQIYANNTTDTNKQGYGDFITNFHDFMKFKLHSISKPTTTDQTNEYNNLSNDVTVDESKSTDSVIIADAVSEVTDLFGLDKTSSSLQTEYADWVKPTDILIEAKTQGMDANGIVASWWTIDHYEQWVTAYDDTEKGYGSAGRGMDLKIDDKGYWIANYQNSSEWQKLDLSKIGTAGSRNCIKKEEIDWIQGSARTEEKEAVAQEVLKRKWQEALAQAAKARDGSEGAERGEVVFEQLEEVEEWAKKFNVLEGVSGNKLHDMIMGGLAGVNVGLLGDAAAGRAIIQLAAAPLAAAPLLA